MVVEVALSCKLRCLLAEKVLSLSVACFGCVEIGACSSKECEGWRVCACLGGAQSSLAFFLLFLPTISVRSKEMSCFRNACLHGNLTLASASLW